ncbi:MAG: HTH-type transcriptional repressor KstR2 [Syntrophorhabdus sp. PtaU1.Bin058]|nr:MAG: HTH-type transcriptional repressor KstR2 [Syntrophorhabdus sp. PtaU1.Bin058]
MFDTIKQTNVTGETPADTRKRILETAGEVFAMSGYRNTTIREICRSAGVNIAAVNYHFGNKEGLYLAVLKYRQEVAFRKYPLDFGTASTDPPEERLRAFIRSFVTRILGEGEVSRFGRLMAREYIEPTNALDTVVEETIRPLFTRLSSIVRQLLGRKPKEETVRLCSASVVGQCLYFLYAAPVIKRLFQQPEFGPKEIEAIADHIAEFSLYAIGSFAVRKGGEKG